MLMKAKHIIQNTEDYQPLLFISCTMIISFFSSRYITSLIGTSDLCKKVLTVLIYLPFALFFLMKLIDGIKSKNKNISTYLYYVFVAYYFIISIVRFFNGVNIKYSLYYTIVLVGSISYFSIIYKRSQTNKKENVLSKNIIIINLFVIIYWFIFIAFFKKTIEYSPINENIIGSMLLILFLTDEICFDKAKFKSRNIIYCISVFFTCTIIFTLASRAVFYLFILEIIITLGIKLFLRKHFIKYIFSILLSVLCVISLYYFNIGNVRYSIDRELSFLKSSEVSNAVDEDTPTEQSSSNSENDASVKQSSQTCIANETPVPSSDPVFSQVERSDNMRNYLLHQGIEQIVINPLFGTGKVLFSYETISGVYYLQSSHNFVLELLDCYGIIGGLLIGGMFVTAFYKYYLYCSSKKLNEFNKSILLLLVFIFLCESMVEPIAFDVLVLPLLMTALASMLVSMNAQK